MLEIIQSNWLFLAPLGILSLVSLTIIIHSLHLAIKFPILKDAKWERFLMFLQENQFLKAKLLLKRDGPLHDLMSFFETEPAANASHMERNLLANAQGWLNRLESKASFLPILANTSTLIGLLGTVTGMIQAFLVMQELGVADPASLAGGISSALVTTAAGLIVAIPSMFVGNWMESRQIKQTQHLEILVSELSIKRKENQIFLEDESLNV